MIGAMAARRVWIVTHFEFLGPSYRRDELISHVASTKLDALRFLRALTVDPGTWWGVQPFAVDATWDAHPGPQVLYSRDGRVLRRGYSLKQALRLGRKARARKKKKGGTKHAPSRPS